MESISKTYFVYRQNLAQTLFANGFKGERVPNAMNPDKMAWAFPLSKELVKVITNYYEDRGLTIPSVILNYKGE